MLVRFDSEVGSFTMFGEPAMTLLKMMGHSGTVPSAILAQDIPAALARLKAAVDADPEAPLPGPQAGHEEAEQRPRISVRQRAYPLIELLARAEKRGCDIVWDQV